MMHKNTHPNYLTSCFERNTSILTVLLCASFVLLSLIYPNIFLSAQNLQSMAFQFSELGIISIAMCLAIVIGGIDLSVAAISNLSAILMSLFLRYAMESGIPLAAAIGLAVVIGITVGAACGVCNGLLIGHLKIPAILATLVTMTLFSGLGIGITKGVTLTGLPKEWLYLGSGTIAGIPIPFIIFAGLAFLTEYLLMRNTFGWSSFLTGTNMRSAQFTGINTNRIILVTHMIIGVTASIAGLIILARTNSASAQYGQSYVLSSILIVILGGIDILGGKGIFKGVLIAVVFLQVLSSGFNLLMQNVKNGIFFKDFIWGFLLLCVMGMRVFPRSLHKKSPDKKELKPQEKNDD